MNRFVWLLMIIPATFFNAGAQVQVTTELERNNILIGDQVNLKINISPQPGIQITGLDYSLLEQIEGLEVVKAKPADTLVLDQSAWMMSQELVLTSFDSGYYFIPPVTVRYLNSGVPDSTKSGDLALLVNTIPNVSDSTQLAPIKNIIGEPLSLSDALPWLLGLLALVGLIIWFRRWRNRPAKEEAPAAKIVPATPPHQIALEQLETLRQAQLWQKGEIKEYHSQLSHIVRTYLEGRFDIPALESTTWEIVQALKNRTDLPPDQVQMLRKLLETSDLVKFAKAVPETGIHEALFEQSRSFVEQTQQFENTEESEHKP